MNKLPNMNLLDFLDITSRKTRVQLAALASVSGLLNTATLVILNYATKAFDNPESDVRLFVLFVLCVSLSLLAKRAVANRLTLLVQSSVYNYRTRIVQKVKDLNLLAFEGIGRSQILTILSEKTEMISQGAHKLADGIPASIMLFGCFVYMATLSGLALFISLLCITAAVVTILIFARALSKTLLESMKKEEVFFHYVHAALDGFKELKVDERKAEDLFGNYLEPAASNVRSNNILSELSNVNLQLYSQGYFYLLMAAVVFVVPAVSELPADTIMAVTTIILFILGPIVVIIDMIPGVTRANVAVAHLYELESMLADSVEAPSPFVSSPFAKGGGFSEIRLNGLGFSYPASEHEPGFSVGPFDLGFRSGEITFVRGGNGSGKSTLLKLLTGLYAPQNGHIDVDGVCVTARNVRFYRGLFGIVFTDFHLFDRLYGREEIDEQRVQALLEDMGLARKTRYEDGRFTNTNLSTGQRKRLALIIAILEDKPIYVFDEIAADQDPFFREYVYTKLLPDLRQKGKTVIAVTHDEKYFRHCDKLMVMEFGRLSLDNPPARQ